MLYIFHVFVITKLNVRLFDFVLIIKQFDFDRSYLN